jgi:hypothetical protein
VTATLVLSGMILIGVFTATLTSLYVGEETDDLGSLSESIDKKISLLKEQLDTRFDEYHEQIQNREPKN